MAKHTVTLSLPTDIFRAMHDMANEKDDTLARVVEAMLSEHLGGHKGFKRRGPPASERLVFALQNLLFRDMAEATSWDDLDRRMRKHGYYLKNSWGGLTVHTETSGQKLCQTHDLGFSYGTFVRRFGPGRPKDPREI